MFADLSRLTVVVCTALCGSAGAINTELTGSTILVYLTFDTLVEDTELSCGAVFMLDTIKTPLLWGIALLITWAIFVTLATWTTFVDLVAHLSIRAIIAGDALLAEQGDRIADFALGALFVGTTACTTRFCVVAELSLKTIFIVFAVGFAARRETGGGHANAEGALVFLWTIRVELAKVDAFL